MKIYELYCGDATTLVAVVDDDGYVISVKTFEDTLNATENAILLLEDTLKSLNCGDVQSMAMTIENFLLKHCRVFPEAS